MFGQHSSTSLTKLLQHKIKFKQKEALYVWNYLKKCFAFAANNIKGSQERQGNNVLFTLHLNSLLNNLTRIEVGNQRQVLHDIDV